MILHTKYTQRREIDFNVLVRVALGEGLLQLQLLVGDHRDDLAAWT